MLYIDKFFDGEARDHERFISILTKHNKTDDQDLRNSLMHACHDKDMSMFGTPDQPVSPHIRAAVVEKDVSGCEAVVWVVTHQGLLLSGDVRFKTSEEVTNRAALTQAEIWARAIEDGGPHGFKGSLKLTISTLHPFSSRAKMDAVSFGEVKFDLFKAVLKAENIFLKHRASNQAHCIFSSQAKQRLGACRKTLFQALDPDVKRVMYQCLDGSMSFLSRLTGAADMTYHPDWEARKREAMKVAHQYPAFVRLLGHETGSLRREVDTYGNMGVGLTEETGLSDLQLRALKGRSYRSLIFAMTSDRRHQNNNPWSQYAKCPPDVLKAAPSKIIMSVLTARDLMDRPLATSNTHEVIRENIKEVLRTQDLKKAFMETEPRPFIRKPNKTSKKRVETSPNHLKPSMMQDTMRFLRKEVVTALVSIIDEQDAEYEDVLFDILAPRTMSQIISATTYYHSQNFSLAKFRMALKERELSWTGLTTGIQMDKGVCKELTTKSALVEQGVKQKHCVGGYDRIVLNQPHMGQTLILSVEMNEEILGTAEVLVTGVETGLSFKVQQFRSVRNAVPAPLGEEVLNTFLQACTRTLGHPDLDVYKASLPKNNHYLVMSSPEDILMGLNSVWSMVTPMLNKAARKMFPQDIIKEILKISLKT